MSIFKKNPLLTFVGAGMLVCGSAMAAFSIAPVDNTAEYEALVTQVNENILLDSTLEQQVQLLDSHQFALSRDGYTRNADTPQTLFERLGIDDDEALTFMRNNTLARMILASNRNVRVVAYLAPDNSLLRLHGYLRSQTNRHFQRVTIERGEDGNLTSVSQTIPVEIRERVVMGTIKYSFFGAATEIGLPDNISYQFFDLFESRIDFTRQLRRGDTFQIVYESYEADGEPLGTGRILAAQFINGSRKYDAVWFEPNETVRGNYYTFDGNSLRTTFLAYPLEYTRVSSNFGRRFHPILQTWREHRGIDYAAPTGTPIRTVGDGRVEFAGVQNGYGNVVIVSHDKSRTTLYAHMSRIDVTRGQVLQQGDIVGAVGQTGWATGPHLHFEFRENGVQRDPRILATQTEAQPIPEEFMAEFERTSQTNSELLARVADLMVITPNETVASSSTQTPQGQ